MTNDEEDFVQSKDIPVIYVDTFRIGYDAYKFVLDLGSIPPGGETREFTTRVIMGPDSAQAFVETFRQSIKEYEGQFNQK